MECLGTLREVPLDSPSRDVGGSFSSRVTQIQRFVLVVLLLNPGPASPGYSLPLQIVLIWIYSLPFVM